MSSQGSTILQTNPYPQIKSQESLIKNNNNSSGNMYSQSQSIEQNQFCTKGEYIEQFIQQEKQMVGVDNKQNNSQEYLQYQKGLQQTQQMRQDNQNNHSNQNNYGSWDNQNTQNNHNNLNYQNTQNNHSKQSYQNNQFNHNNQSYQNNQNQQNNQLNQQYNQNNQYNPQSNQYINQNNYQNPQSNQYNNQSNQQNHQSNQYNNQSNQQNHQSNQYNNQNTQNNHSNQNNQSYQNNQNNQYNQQNHQGGMSQMEYEKQNQKAVMNNYQNHQNNLNQTNQTHQVYQNEQQMQKFKQIDRQIEQEIQYFVYQDLANVLSILQDTLQFFDYVGTSNQNYVNAALNRLILQTNLSNGIHYDCGFNFKTNIQQEFYNYEKQKARDIFINIVNQIRLPKDETIIDCLNQYLKNLENQTQLRQIPPKQTQKGDFNQNSVQSVFNGIRSVDNSLEQISRGTYKKLEQSDIINILYQRRDRINYELKKNFKQQSN